MTKSAKQILLDAADLLSGNGAWTQGAYGRDMFGSKVPARTVDAVCWCVLGAIERVTPKNGSSISSISALSRMTGESSVSIWNDDKDQTKANIIAILRQCAAEMED